MGILDLFKGSQPTDPYWHFTPEIHYKPKINRADFFTKTAFDFGWLMLEPLSIMVDSPEQELEKNLRMSFGQKALYYWWYLDAQVTNGGFVQFYYNGYGQYAPTIVKGLELIGDKKMASLVQKAHNEYLRNKKMLDRYRETDFFGTDVYERLDKLTALDEDYYELHDGTMTKLEEYIRKHPSEFCVTETGEEYSTSYYGAITTSYPNGQLKEEFTLKHGVIDGDYKTYFENGNPESIVGFTAGEKTGEERFYFENGKLQREATPMPDDTIRHLSYYENGNKKKLEHKDHKNENKGEEKKWYENGQLKEEAFYTSNFEREGPWLMYYPDGHKKMEAEGKDGEVFFHNYWNEQGEQLLINGTGLYINEFTIGRGQHRYETKYKNYQRHGLCLSYSNGILSLSQEYFEGKEHGVTLNFYDNGNIKEEKVYEYGQLISEKEFNMFQSARVAVTIRCEMEDEWLTNRGLETADTYPAPLNDTNLSQAMQVDISLFDGYSQDTEVTYTYFVDVDVHGRVTKYQFLVADNGRITEAVEANIQKLMFSPATKRGNSVNSHVIVRHVFQLAEA
jgi:antitoxin component YwqK of YwqJK toxin-antitoxin module